MAHPRRWRLARGGGLRLLAAVFVMLAVLLTLVGGLHGALRAEGASREPAEGSQRYYVVQPGDTLWAIAVHLGGPASDPRRLALAIQQRNSLASPLIRPGQVLQLPPY